MISRGAKERAYRILRLWALIRHHLYYGITLQEITNEIPGDYDLGGVAHASNTAAGRKLYRDLEVLKKSGRIQAVSVNHGDGPEAEYGCNNQLRFFADRSFRRGRTRWPRTWWC